MIIHIVSDIRVDHGCYIDTLEQDCSNSIANALELLQSCAMPSIWCTMIIDIVSGISVDHGCYNDTLAQDCSNSIANALELLQSCAKQSIW